MRHEESKLQQQCVYWFRTQYPQYAMLMTHPINEGNDHSSQDRRRQAIHKAEGTVRGVPDLLLFMPASIFSENDDCKCYIYHGLGIELKTQKGRQSDEQKDYERIFTAAGYLYVIIRSLDDFKKTVNDYIANVYPERRKQIASAHVEIVQAQNKRELEFFKKVIGKK